jgi:hypothetical protein
VNPKFLDWMERFATAFAFFFLGKRVGSQEKAQLQNELDEANLNLEMRDNQDEVDAKFSGMSDSDVIDDAIARGRKPKVPGSK